MSEPTHIYIDVEVYNNSITAEDSSPKPIVFNDKRQNDYVTNPSDYYLSITRFSLGSQLPVIIPQMKLGQTQFLSNGALNPQWLDTVYSFTISLTTAVDGITYESDQTFLKSIISQNAYLLPPTIPLLSMNDVYDNPFFHIDSIEWFVNTYCNTALELALVNLNAKYQTQAPPYIPVEYGFQIIEPYNPNNATIPTNIFQTPLTAGQYDDFIVTNTINGFVLYDSKFYFQDLKNLDIWYLVLPQLFPFLHDQPQGQGNINNELLNDYTINDYNSINPVTLNINTNYSYDTTALSSIACSPNSFDNTPTFYIGNDARLFPANQNGLDIQNVSLNFTVPFGSINYQPYTSLNVIQINVTAGASTFDINQFAPAYGQWTITGLSQGINDVTTEIINVTVTDNTIAFFITNNTVFYPNSSFVFSCPNSTYPYQSATSVSQTFVGYIGVTNLFTQMSLSILANNNTVPFAANINTVINTLTSGTINATSTSPPITTLNVANANLYNQCKIVNSQIQNFTFQIASGNWSYSNNYILIPSQDSLDLTANFFNTNLGSIVSFSVNNVNYVITGAVLLINNNTSMLVPVNTNSLDTTKPLIFSMIASQYANHQFFPQPNPYFIVNNTNLKSNALFPTTILDVDTPIYNIPPIYTARVGNTSALLFININLLLGISAQPVQNYSAISLPALAVNPNELTQFMIQNPVPNTTSFPPNTYVVETTTTNITYSSPSWLPYNNGNQGLVIGSSMMVPTKINVRSPITNPPAITSVVSQPFITKNNDGNFQLSYPEIYLLENSTPYQAQIYMNTPLFSLFNGFNALNNGYKPNLNADMTNGKNYLMITQVLSNNYQVPIPLQNPPQPAIVKLTLHNDMVDSTIMIITGLITVDLIGYTVQTSNNVFPINTIIVANLTILGDPNTTYILSQLATVDVLNNSSVSASLVTSETLYFITTEYPSVGMWSPVSSIVFLSTLPVNPSMQTPTLVLGEKADIQVNPSNLGLANIISDFQINLDSSTPQQKTPIQYTPAGEYRLYDLVGNQKMSDINIMVMWRDKIAGSLHTFYLNSGMNASIKFMLRKKSYFVGANNQIIKQDENPNTIQYNDGSGRSGGRYARY